MRDDLYQILGAIKDDPEVQAVIFRGAGEKAFCAGADLSEFLTAPAPVAAREVRWERDVWGLFLTLHQPLVAALHGYVLGSGIEIALCCDLRIASMDVQFGLPEVGLGIIPAAGGTQTLPRSIGRARSLEVLFSGRWLDAREAYDLGLVNQLVARQELLPTAEAIARKIGGHNWIAVRCAKRAINKGFDLSLDQGLEMERRLGNFVLKAKALAGR